MLLFKFLKLIVASCLFFLTACGYQPLINFNQKSHAILSSGNFILFAPKNDIDFHIKESLLKDFGYPQNPKYQIELKSTLEKSKSIITENNENTRYNLKLISTLNLIELNTKKIIFAKKIISVTAFTSTINMTGFQTETAKKYAEHRLAFDTADKIRIEILINQKEIFS